MRQTVQQPQFHIGALQIGILLLILATANAHLYLGGQPDEDLRTWFLLNGLGYLVLLLAFFLPQFMPIHRLIRWALLGYATLTIILWFFFGSLSEGRLDPFDAVVKTVEIALVVLLLIDNRQSHSRRFLADRLQPDR